MKTILSKPLVTMLASFVFATAWLSPPASAENAPGVTYKTVEIEGLDIFYREAGDPRQPTLLLLHGFPTSSHMFRDLIAELAANIISLRRIIRAMASARCRRSRSSSIRSTT